MTSKKPLAFLLVAVMAVSLFAAAPVAASGDNDCTATAVNSGDATNLDQSSDSAGNNLDTGQYASTSAYAEVDVDQYSYQSNSITEYNSGDQTIVTAVQANSNTQEAC